MRIPFRPVALLVLASLLTIPLGKPRAAQHTASPAEKLLAEVHRILAGSKQTQYSHKTHVDEAKGVFELDSSGLACDALKRVLPEHYRKIPVAGRMKRPHARDFHDLFVQAPPADRSPLGWRQVSRLADARPGDILAYRTTDPAAKSTGHVVFLDSVAVPDGAGQFRVTVIDSTISRHAQDTRLKGHSGVGRGVMWFTVDAQGRPLGYRWASRTGTLRERRIAIGRAVNLSPYLSPTTSDRRGG